MSKKISFTVSGLWYYLLGRIIATLHYDKAFISGRWFYDRKWHGVFNPGWKWVVVDHFGNRRFGINQRCPLHRSAG